MKRILKPLLIPISALCLLPISCTNQGLEPVSGMEGEIIFHDNWPDSIKGAFLVALDEGAASDEDHPEDYILTYGAAILPGTDIAPYFIQLDQGAYYMGLLGIQTDPAFFITKLDSFLNSENIPIFQITDPFEGVIISDDETIRKKNWNIYFNGGS